MSIQNLKKPNNYNIFADEITCKYLYADDSEFVTIKGEAIEADFIYSLNNQNVSAFDLSNNSQIIVGKSLIPSGDDGLSLGSGSVRFKDLNIYNIYGPGNTFPVNINRGILINGASSPNNQSIFGNYFELSSTPSTLATASGPYSVANNPQVKYIATRVGNTVSLKLAFNLGDCDVSSALLTIDNFGTIFNDNFLPETNTCFLINIQVGTFSSIACLGKIQTDGKIVISTLSGGSIAFTAGEPVGLGVLDGEYMQINYNL